MRVEKGCDHHLSIDGLTQMMHGDDLTYTGAPPLQHGQRHGVSKVWARVTAGHEAIDKTRRARWCHDMRSDWQPRFPVYWYQADQLHACVVQRCRPSQRAASHKVGGFLCDATVHADISWQCRAVSVAAHVQKTFFGAHHHQGFNAVWHHAKVMPEIP